MSLAQTIPWEQYQQLAPDQRRRPLTDAEYAALTPQQRVALGLDENEQGAPADFNGPVIPNPAHIQPRFDTDPRIDPTRLPEGVTFQHGNWSGSPQMDVSNPAAADVQPAMGREVGVKMSAAPMKLPPGASLESAPDAQGMKLPTGATLETAPPAQSGQSAPHDQFAEDRATTEAWAQKHPVLGPIVRFLVAGGQNAANAITDTPGQLYHAIVDPPEPEEAGMKPEQRVIYRLGIKQAVHAGADYASGQVTPKGAASVLPEALGTGVGQVSGGAVYGKAAEVAPELAGAAAEAVPKVIRAARNVTPKQIAQVAGTATGAGLGHGTLSVPGAYYGAKGAGAIAESVLGKTRANAPIFGGEPAPATAAGSMAEGVAAPKPAPVTPAQLEGPLNDALGGQKLQPGVSLRNQPAAMAAARGKLPEGFTPVDSSVLKGYKYDPDTQEFTAITQNGQSYTHGEVTPDQVASFEKSPSQGKAWTSEIRNNNVLVKKNGLPVRPGVKPEAEPTQAAPASPDLTQQLQDSLDAVRSKKASGTAPARGQQPFQRTIVTDPETGRPEFSDVVANNGSGGGPDSLEAISRLASQKAGGVKIFKIHSLSNVETPLFGVDAVDAQPGPYDVIVERKPNGEEVVVSQGARARPLKPKTTK